MRPLLKLLLLPTLLVLTAAQGKGQTRTIEFSWPNDPCQQNINCPGGCSACNEAVGQDAVVVTPAPVFIGVEVCPHADGNGDNALTTSGWAIGAEDEHRIIIHGLVRAEARIDSVIVVHHTSEGGPARLVCRVQDLGDGGGAVKDVQVPVTACRTVIAQAGVVQVPEGAEFGNFQVQLQAYGGGSGDWILDDVRIVVTVLDEGMATGVVELKPQRSSNTQGSFDLLGRELAPAADGLHIHSGTINAR